jgi:hypothetical protein
LIETHPTPALALQGQSRAVETVTVPVPPLALNDAAVVLSVAWHLAESGADMDVCVLVEQLPHRNGASVSSSLTDDFPM